MSQGLDTCPLALSWVWYLLSQHPEVEDKLAAELQAVLGGLVPNVAHLPQCTRNGREGIDATLPAYLGHYPRALRTATSAGINCLQRARLCS